MTPDRPGPDREHDEPPRLWWSPSKAREIPGAVLAGISYRMESGKYVGGDEGGH